MDFKLKYGDYALITGASSGIGKEFAEQLASKGLDLILVARRKNRLDELAASLQQKHKIKIKTVGIDLLESGALDKLVDATKDLEIGLLIPNAGMETHGNFVENSLQTETDVQKLNTQIPMQLAHLFGAKMKSRKKGGIIFISSTFGHQSVPFFANYAATKAYILSFGQALNYELKQYNVDVTVLSPGLTKTEMAANMNDIDFKKMPITAMEVAPVVRKAINALGKRQAVISGTWNNTMDIMGKFMTPRWVLTNMFGFLINRATIKNNFY